VIAQAVTEANRNPAAKILVLAPETDATGKARRADAVQAALVAAGVARDRIDARWTGPQGLPPGVRDPHSRAVEISFEPNSASVGDLARVYLSKRSSD
jgi:hypothetical protein